MHEHECATPRNDKMTILGEFAKKGETILCMHAVEDASDRSKLKKLDRSNAIRWDHKRFSD